jgi:uncharacterized protein
MTFVKAILAGAAVVALLATPAAAQDRSKWPQSMTLGTASPGGTFAIYGQGFAQIISDIVKVPTSTQQTQGPNQNLVLVQTKRADLGMTTMGPAYEAWNGELELNKGVQHRDIRALFPMYETPFQIVSIQKPGAPTSVKELDGKIVGVGPKAGTCGTYFPRWFKEVGINPTIRNGGASDMAAQLMDGRLDAFAFCAGLPIAAFSEIETQQKVNFFNFSKDEIAKLLKTNPYVSEFTIPKDTYKQQKEDQLTLSMWNFAFAHKDVPADLAYEIVKAVLENNKRMVQTHAAAETTVPKNYVHNKFIYWHPGAIRYYEEKGFKIPAELYPPEAKKS